MFQEEDLARYKKKMTADMAEKAILVMAVPPVALERR